VTKAGSGKTRAAFYLRTTPMTRASRRLCRDAVKLAHHARRPGKLIDLKAIKADTYVKAKPLDAKTIVKLNAFTARSGVLFFVYRTSVEKNSIQNKIRYQNYLPLHSRAKFSQDSSRRIII
jgi:hypothetical protein